MPYNNNKLNIQFGFVCKGDVNIVETKQNKKKRSSWRQPETKMENPFHHTHTYTHREKTKNKKKQEKNANKSK